MAEKKITRDQELRQQLGVLAHKLSVDGKEAIEAARVADREALMTSTREAGVHGKVFSETVEKARALRDQTKRAAALTLEAAQRALKGDHARALCKADTDFAVARDEATQVEAKAVAPCRAAYEKQQVEIRDDLKKTLEALNQETQRAAKPLQDELVILDAEAQGRQEAYEKRVAERKAAAEPAKDAPAAT